jgi:hypothetical protein
LFRAGPQKFRVGFFSPIALKIAEEGEGGKRRRGGGKKKERRRFSL